MTFLSLECPITLEKMVDPVICTGDGVTYERAAIEEWLKTNKTSPSTNVLINSNAMLIPNHALRNAISELPADSKASSPAQLNRVVSSTPTAAAVPVVSIGVDGLLALNPSDSQNKVSSSSSSSSSPPLPLFPPAANPKNNGNNGNTSNSLRTFDNIIIGGSAPPLPGGYLER